MTGRITFTPQAERHLNKFYDWITKAVSAEIARRWDVRTGMRITTFRKRTVVAYGSALNWIHNQPRLIGPLTDKMLTAAFADMLAATEQAALADS